MFLSSPAMHELRGPPDTAAHLAFALHHLAPVAGPLLLVGTRPSWYPPGLAALGVDPARCLFAAARTDDEGLAALEVALRGGMAALGECGALSRLAARRLSLAAKSGGVLGILLRHAPEVTALDSTAFASRWFITPAPGGAVLARRLYAKGAAPAEFTLELGKDDVPTPALPLPAARRRA
jgi:protein ImuA